MFLFIYLKLFLNRFYFEGIDSQFFAVLPCVFLNLEERTLDIALFNRTFRFFYGSIENRS